MSCGGAPAGVLAHRRPRGLQAQGLERGGAAGLAAAKPPADVAANSERRRRQAVQRCGSARRGRFSISSSRGRPQRPHRFFFLCQRLQPELYAMPPLTEITCAVT